VMQELGIDISGHTSKHIRDFLPPNGSVPDLIIGVCSKADENCPVFPAAVERLHWPFDDPYHAQGDEQTRLNEFRRVRDEILARLKSELA
ncbi:MAG: arsenate reductase ArsC, partial [Planctomycetaceae bacterium]|nr:arsenate reductase ArsC [Planctomycetaceae bacterium]